MTDLDNVQARLKNLRTVEPILSALRTISLGSWRTVSRRRTHVRAYAERLAAVIQTLLPVLPGATGRLSQGDQAAQTGDLNGGALDADDQAEAAAPVRHILLVMLGSERGLCGRFNAAVVERANRYLAEAGADQVETAVLGARLARLYRRTGRVPVWTRSVPAASVLPFRVLFGLVRDWIARFESHRLDAVDVVYNAYRGPGVYTTTVTRLLPCEVPAMSTKPPEAWPPPYIETEALGILARALEQWAALRFYELLIESAAAEHSTRYQLMEAATQNAKRLIEALTLEHQAARRQAITREMQELAAGAGLVGPQRPR